MVARFKPSQTASVLSRAIFWRGHIRCQCLWDTLYLHPYLIKKKCFLWVFSTEILFYSCLILIFNFVMCNKLLYYQWIKLFRYHWVKLLVYQWIKLFSYQVIKLGGCTCPGFWLLKTVLPFKTTSPLKITTDVSIYHLK